MKKQTNEFNYKELILIQESIYSRIETIETLLKLWQNETNNASSKDLYMSYLKHIDKLKELSKKINEIFN